MIGEGGGAVGRLEDLLGIAAQGVGRGELIQDHLVVARDDGQHVIEIVRHAPRQAADRFHPLDLNQVRFGLQFLRQPQRFLAPPGEFQAGAHGTDVGVGEVGVSILDMLAADRFGQKHLNGRTEHLRASVAEHLLCAGVCEYDPAGAIDADDGLGSGLQQSGNHVLAVCQESRDVLVDRRCGGAGLARLGPTHKCIPSCRLIVTGFEGKRVWRC